MDEMDREILRLNLRAMLLLRAEVKGTTYAMELLALKNELRERKKLNVKSPKGVNSDES